MTEGTYSALSPRASEDFGRYLLDGILSEPLERVLSAKGWLKIDNLDETTGLNQDHKKRLIRWRHPLVCIPAARFILKKKGLAAGLRWARTLNSNAPRLPLSTALRSFSRVAAVLTSSQGDEDCLPKSLALFGFLRSQGFAPELIIGVKRFPFGAHAWVELKGVPLLEEKPESLCGFNEILRTE